MEAPMDFLTVDLGRSDDHRIELQALQHRDDRSFSEGFICPGSCLGGSRGHLAVSPCRSKRNGTSRNQDSPLNVGSNPRWRCAKSVLPFPSDDDEQCRHYYRKHHKWRLWDGRRYRDICERIVIFVSEPSSYFVWVIDNAERGGCIG